MSETIIIIFFFYCPKNHLWMRSSQTPPPRSAPQNTPPPKCKPGPASQRLGLCPGDAGNTHETQPTSRSGPRVFTAGIPIRRAHGNAARGDYTSGPPGPINQVQFGLAGDALARGHRERNSGLGAAPPSGGEGVRHIREPIVKRKTNVSDRQCARVPATPPRLPSQRQL